MRFRFPVSLHEPHPPITPETPLQAGRTKIIVDNSTETLVIDRESPTDSFRQDVLTGLRRSQRRLPCKYFYDKRGSELFDQICELDEYYPTRTELSIMRRFADEMGEQIGEGVMLVEYGSGSSVKTRTLLDHLPDPVAYVPVDISGHHLIEVSEAMQVAYPDIEVLPVIADFTNEFSLPDPEKDFTHAAVYFPGSTIGNFEPQDAERLLRSVAALCGRGGGLLIGIDLVKATETLELAYDDPGGITAEFNLNLLHRMRDELDAEIDIDGFSHIAEYNSSKQRIEIYLQSDRFQSIRIDDEVFEFAAGERIHTENSHKYSIDGFAELAERAGLTLRRSWTDENQYFAVLHLAVQEALTVQEQPANQSDENES